MGCDSLKYTNIIHKEGLECLEEELTNRPWNTYWIYHQDDGCYPKTFDNNYFKQEIGAVMGSRPVPHYANIFMTSQVDNIIRDLSKKFIKMKKVLYNYLKDFLMIIFNICWANKKITPTLGWSKPNPPNNKINYEPYIYTKWG